MQKHIGLVVVCYLGWSGAALAQSIAQCQPYEARTIEMDYESAVRMAASAAAGVGDTETYARWFGQYSNENAEKVRAVLKAIHSRLVDGRSPFVCARKSDRTCGAAYAWVLPATGVVRLCPDYFTLPSVAGAHQGADVNSGTREGTLLHEISHAVAGTRDECRTWADCGTLARRSPGIAITTANSFEYFAEDVTLSRLKASD